MQHYFDISVVTYGKDLVLTSYNNDNPIMYQ